MGNYQYTFETCKHSVISAFSICMTFKYEIRQLKFSKFIELLLTSVNVTTNRSCIYYLAKDVKAIEFNFHFYSMLITKKLPTVRYSFNENRIVY